MIRFLAAGLLVVSASAQPRTILAIGAHAADMDLTAGALLAHQKKLGDRVVMLHLTLGEGGNPKVAPAEYGPQKRREAFGAGKAIGAEVLIGPYADALLPDDEAARKYVAGVIRQIKPNYVVTHWKNSLHKDHRITHAIVSDAILLAEVETVKTGDPAWRGVRGVYYADNWEDAEGFCPYLYVDVSDTIEAWTTAIREYEMVRGGISNFAYFDYYTARLASLGALAGRKYAVALDVEDYAKRRVLDSLRQGTPTLRESEPRPSGSAEPLTGARRSVEPKNGSRSRDGYGAVVTRPPLPDGRGSDWVLVFRWGNAHRRRRT
jgi:LmbE family N-acetylglucosaminyl deacetylase